MTLEVLKPGPQTTIQSAPRTGQRHLGVPSSGPADPLSMALANRLVGNDLLAPALEITLGGMSLRFHSNTAVALTGALGSADNGVQRHEYIFAAGWSVLERDVER